MMHSDSILSDPASPHSFSLKVCTVQPNKLALTLVCRTQSCWIILVSVIQFHNHIMTWEVTVMGDHLDVVEVGEELIVAGLLSEDSCLL